MTEMTPRPCWHTGLAILIVLLAGLGLGAFSPQPKGEALSTQVVEPVGR